MTELTKLKIFNAAKECSTKKYVWTVRVGTRVVPARELVMRVDGTDRKTAKSTYNSVKFLKRQGFKVYYKGQEVKGSVGSVYKQWRKP